MRPLYLDDLAAVIEADGLGTGALAHARGGNCWCVDCSDHDLRKFRGRKPLALWRWRVCVLACVSPADVPEIKSSPAQTHKTASIFPMRAAIYRSEERRVGKEGRSRWSPYH